MIGAEIGDSIVTGSEGKNIFQIVQGRSQDFFKGGSSTSIELLEAGVWGSSPQPLRGFQYFNKSKLSKLLYFTLIMMH